MTCRVCGLPNESAWSDPDGVCSTCREADKPKRERPWGLSGALMILPEKEKPKTCGECGHSRSAVDSGLSKKAWKGFLFCSWEPEPTPMPMWAGKLTVTKLESRFFLPATDASSCPCFKRKEK